MGGAGVSNFRVTPLQVAGTQVVSGHKGIAICIAPVEQIDRLLVGGIRSGAKLFQSARGRLEFDGIVGVHANRFPKCTL